MACGEPRILDISAICDEHLGQQVSRVEVREVGEGKH